MSQSRIHMSPKEIETLLEWVNSFDEKPHRVTIISEETGIGNALRAEIETADGEGRWKDLTDYENW